MYICKHCGKECKNLNALRQHEIRCKENPDRIHMVSNFIKYNEKVRKGEIEKINKNHFAKAKKLGLPIPTVSEETRLKISKAGKGRKHTELSKQKISNGMQRAVRENPDSYSASNVNGRVKKVEYNGILLDSSWEVEVAKYLDSNNIKWERPKIGLEYEWNGVKRLYYPDFYLLEYNRYIEVKGYIRDRDLCKWEQFPDIIIIKRSEIDDIKSNNYNIFDLLNNKLI